MEQLLGAIGGILNDLEPNAAAREALVFAAWDQKAGEMLRARTTPIEFNDKRLVVAVEDKTWQRNLEELCPQMLAKINTTLGHGTVTFIEFRIQPRRKSEPGT